MKLITGGARSGKSTFAESLMEDYSEVCYIATARPSDDEEMKERIAKHRSRRPDHWHTLEGDRNLASNLPAADAVLLDCVTVLLSNYLFDSGEELTEGSIQKVEDEVKEELMLLSDFCEKENIELVFVTNEVGSGIVPMHPLSRAFRDIQGRVNQFLASRAEEVYLVVSGIPVRIK
ncbi:adenosylcobalamin biosynthesis protein CobU [Aedoeadaptatus nemausensis]|uniref:Adenosylcobinamide kinase n=1 Tax=Aedoeadaptatus nemausensis TaxID=2582829 RepID=A0A6V6XZZ3_9FIRM|nr:bifunctional adenosylcobinamide kinase/adenosylcobinamide-phosphate guanylyltransferase [Peptoniphilus nemausensis]CAC9925358.1 adenosylcobalamin biosynthesis protein CobU [Peptoniphilus nemausensis]